jgi:hypothetical protein
LIYFPGDSSARLQINCQAIESAQASDPIFHSISSFIEAYTSALETNDEIKLKVWMDDPAETWTKI